jgi:hypothetical protein
VIQILSGIIRKGFPLHVAEDLPFIFSVPKQRNGSAAAVRLNNVAVAVTSVGLWVAVVLGLRERLLKNPVAGHIIDPIGEHTIFIWGDSDTSPGKKTQEHRAEDCVHETPFSGH